MLSQLVHAIKTVFMWFSGGEKQYMDFAHCMNHDWLWIYISVLTNLLVIVGYLATAKQWRRSSHLIAAGEAKKCLNRLMFIFILCGLCGYAFTIIKLWWPGIRLLNIIMMILIYYTWMYVFRSHSLDSVYKTIQEAQETIQTNLELKEAKKELEQLTRDLSKSNEELEQFAYIASHDLKSPLRAVGNLAQWVEEDLAGGKDISENIDLIKSRIMYMNHLIDDLLEYSKLNRQSVERKNINVGDLIKDMVLLLSVDKVSIKITTPLPVVKANPVRLEQVFSNLLNNAIKHNDKPHVEIELSATEDNKLHHFCVSDNGPGIDPSFHKKIFLIFQTLKPKSVKEMSTGIGLTLVQRIIEDLGGEIWVESSLGNGTKFHFTIPK